MRNNSPSISITSPVSDCIIRLNGGDKVRHFFLYVQQVWNFNCNFPIENLWQAICKYDIFNPWHRINIFYALFPGFDMFYTQKWRLRKFLSMPYNDVHWKKINFFTYHRSVQLARPILLCTHCFLSRTFLINLLIRFTQKFSVNHTIFLRPRKPRY